MNDFVRESNDACCSWRYDNRFILDDCWMCSVLALQLKSCDIVLSESLSSRMCISNIICEWECSSVTNTFMRRNLHRLGTQKSQVSIAIHRSSVDDPKDKWCTVLKTWFVRWRITKLTECGLFTQREMQSFLMLKYFAGIMRSIENERVVTEK